MVKTTQKLDLPWSAIFKVIFYNNILSICQFYTLRYSIFQLLYQRTMAFLKRYTPRVRNSICLYTSRLGVRPNLLTPISFYGNSPQVDTIKN